VNSSIIWRTGCVQPFILIQFLLGKIAAVKKQPHSSFWKFWSFINRSTVLV